MQFKPVKMYDSLNNGSYEGIIKEIAFKNEKSCTFKIKIDNKEGVFVYDFKTDDIAFNNFAIDYINDEGYFAPEKIIEKNIQFEIIERTYNDNKYYKIISINVA